jgi:transcriptional regulator with GAF, ATPase, and Fis domain
VVGGPQAGLSLKLDDDRPPRLLIGKSSSAELRLTDPLVSRRHVAIDTEERAVRVTDLRSKNGTFVNGVRVVEAWIEPGDVLRVGSTEIRLVETDGVRAVQGAMAGGFGKLVGQSVAMRRLRPLLEKLAAASIPVLIEGETGTGKEVLAESLHEEGPRAGGPFVVFDCSAVHGPLLESALFGHEKGAFTGAVSQRRGAFEQAHGGTLFIDEIGELDLALQPKLLRAVQRGEIQRVGGDRWIKVDVRILVATRRDLDREVQEGRFRDDLFFRLAVGRVELPPLRRRLDDVPLLARHFWARLGDGAPMPVRLLRELGEYSWPGNVRELENTIARKIMLGDALLPEQLADEGTGGHEPGARSLASSASPGPEDVIATILRENLPLPVAKERVIAELERRYVAHLLAQHEGNATRAAAASGIARRYFNLLRARHRTSSP